MIYRYVISEELPFSFLPYRLIYLYLFFTRSRAKLFLLLKSNVRLTHRRFSLAFVVKSEGCHREPLDKFRRVSAGKKRKRTRDYREKRKGDRHRY